MDNRIPAMVANFSIEELGEAMVRHPKLGVFGRMTFPEFILALCTSVTPNIELVIKNQNNEFLLTWRQDADFTGWHFPGSAINFDEVSIFDTCARVAQKEVGVAITNIQVAGIRNYSPKENPRHFKDLLVPTHYFGIICLAELAPGQIPKDGRFFGQMPGDLLDCHKKIFRMGLDFLKDPRPVILVEGKN
jgi:hypothetical protein